MMSFYLGAMIVMRLYQMSPKRDVLWEASAPLPCAARDFGQFCRAIALSKMHLRRNWIGPQSS